MPFEHLAPLPAPPAYGTATVAEVLPSAAAALGVEGCPNPLALPSAPRVVVIMVDGLGMTLLRRYAAHAPYLRDALDSARVLSSAFPSTTAASLASFGTGLAPGSHGMVGYDVLDPVQDKVVNMLGRWDPGVDPIAWQPHPTVLERVAEQLPVVTVSQPRFEGSAMTRAALRGGTFLAAGTVHARVDAAAQALAASPRLLMYFYLNDLDKAGHRYGVASPQWVRALEDLDGAVKLLARRVPADTLLVLTADHGMVDVPASQRIDYSARPELLEGVAHTGGEPRMVHLYLEAALPEERREALVERWQEAFGNRAWVLTRAQAVAEGYFGAVAPEVLPRIGDVLVLAREPIALIDGRRASEAAFEMVGQHGSLTRAEREVPLLILSRPPGVAQRGRGARGRRG